MAPQQETNISSEAHAAVTKAVTNPDEFGSLRASGGDCFAGAVAAGADRDSARDISTAVHTDPVLRTKVASTGGLMLGALRYLEMRDARG